jgi:hypothetical protein
MSSSATAEVEFVVGRELCCQSVQKNANIFCSACFPRVSDFLARRSVWDLVIEDENPMFMRA